MKGKRREEKVPELHTTHHEQVPDGQHLAFLVHEKDLRNGSGDECFQRRGGEALHYTHQRQREETSSEESPCAGAEEEQCGNQEDGALSPHGGCSGSEECARAGGDLQQPDEREGDLVGGYVECCLDLVEARGYHRPEAVSLLAFCSLVWGVEEGLRDGNTSSQRHDEENRHLGAGRPIERIIGRVGRLWLENDISSLLRLLILPVIESRGVDCLVEVYCPRYLFLSDFLLEGATKRTNIGIPRILENSPPHVVCLTWKSAFLQTLLSTNARRRRVILEEIDSCHSQETKQTSRGREGEKRN